jgi:hypothetical protein
VNAKRLNHLYWITATKDNIEMTDRAWNYCDEKCLFFENVVDDTDFLVIYFKDK